MIDTDLVGLTKESAIDLLKQEGVEWRILSEDGESFAGTCDWKPFRRTLSISDGKVISVTRG